MIGYELFPQCLNGSAGPEEDVMHQPGIRKNGFPSDSHRYGQGGRSGLALILGALALFMGTVSNALTPTQSQPKAGPAVAANSFTTSEAHGLWTHFRPPDGVPNLALRSAGNAWATVT